MACRWSVATRPRRPKAFRLGGRRHALVPAATRTPGAIAFSRSVTGEWSRRSVSPASRGVRRWRSTAAVLRARRPSSDRVFARRGAEAQSFVELVLSSFRPVRGLQRTEVVGAVVAMALDGSPIPGRVPQHRRRIPVHVPVGGDSPDRRPPSSAPLRLCASAREPAVQLTPAGAGECDPPAPGPCGTLPPSTRTLPCAAAGASRIGMNVPHEWEDSGERAATTVRRRRHQSTAG